MSTTITNTIAATAQTGPGIAASLKSFLPLTQRQLLLHQAHQPYEIHPEGDLPTLRFGELLVEVSAIGLNPIDWKSAAFGFALPSFPCLNGREFVGKIVASEVDASCDLTVGNWVLAVSTDYRDFRKSAFQEYAIVCCYNAIKIPPHIDPCQVAAVGVAFVAASIALGVCLGVALPWEGHKLPELRLLSLAQEQNPEDVPADIRDEIFNGIKPGSQAHKGEWILIYGASSISAQVTIQLAKLAGLKVVGVADLSKHKERLETLGVDVLVDRTDLEQAERDIKRLVPGSLRFALDTVGKETASWCQNVLAARSGSRYSSPDLTNGNTSPESGVHQAGGGTLSHVVGLTGLPKTPLPNIQSHRVPIKLFHTNRRVGSKLSKWLYELLDNGQLKLPEVEVVNGGLDVINSELARLRKGELSGKRLVVKLKDNEPAASYIT